MASAVILNKQMGLSFGKIGTLLRQHYDIRVSWSGLGRAVHRAARRAELTYSGLRRQLPNSPVVTPDETGWKVGGHLQWLWTGASEKTTVYAIQPGRGYEEAAHLLGPDFDGVLIRDGWAPYRRFTRATHQTCLAHLLRRGRTLCRDHPRSRIAADIHALLKRALRLRDDARAGELSRDNVGEALEALAARLARRLLHPGPLAAVQCFAKHLTTEWNALFTFLRNPAIDATNWRAEQAIRFRPSRRATNIGAMGGALISNGRCRRSGPDTYNEGIAIPETHVLDIAEACADRRALSRNTEAGPAV